MVLEKATIPIPHQLGIRQDVDEYSMESQGVVTAENIIFDDRGDVSRRLGSVAMGKTPVGEAAGIIIDRISDVSTHQGDTVAIARRATVATADGRDYGMSLFRRTDAAIGSDKWLRIGWAQPCQVSVTPGMAHRYTGTGRIASYDMAVLTVSSTEHYIVLVVNRYDSATSTWAGDLTIKSLETGVVVSGYDRILLTNGISGLHKILVDSTAFYVVCSCTSTLEYLFVVKFNRTPPFAWVTDAAFGSLGTTLTTDWLWDVACDGTYGYVARVNLGAGNVIALEKITLSTNTTAANTTFTITGAVNVAYFLNCQIIGSYLVVVYADSASPSYVWYKTFNLSDLSEVAVGQVQVISFSTTTATPLRATVTTDGEYTGQVHVLISVKQTDTATVYGVSSTRNTPCTSDVRVPLNQVGAVNEDGKFYNAVSGVRAFSYEGKPILIGNNCVAQSPSDENEYPTYYVDTLARQITAIGSTTSYRRTLAHLFPGTADDGCPQFVTAPSTAVRYGYTSALVHPTLGDGVWLVALTRDDGGVSDHMPTIQIVTLDFRNPDRNNGVFPQGVGFASEQKNLFLATGGLVAEAKANTVRENGFLDVPQAIQVTATSASGYLAAGSTYYYKAIYEHIDINGDIVRSATSLPLALTPSALADNSPWISIRHYKHGDVTANTDSRIVLYRTTAGGSVYYRLPIGHEADASSAVTTPTRATIVDTYSDAQLAGQEIIYTQAGELDNYPPPASSIVCYWKNRIFLVNAEDPTEIRYSKEKVQGIAYEFNPLLSFRIPDGGGVTALSVQDDKLIAFKEDRIFVVFGDGLASNGYGNNFQFQLIASDIGTGRKNSVLSTSEGTFFCGVPGIHLLDRSLQVKFIGNAIRDDFLKSGGYTQTVTGVYQYPDKPMVAFVAPTPGGYTNHKTYFYNYELGLWSTLFSSSWTGPFQIVDVDGYPAFLDRSVGGSGVDSLYCLNNSSTYKDGGSSPEQINYTTGWMTLTGVPDDKKFYWISILGYYNKACTLQVRVYYDFDSSSYTDFSQVGSVGVLNFRMSIPGRHRAIKLKIYDSNWDVTYGRGFSIKGISAEVGLSRGQLKQLTSAQTG